MLILTRKRGEDIVINDNITVRLVEIRGDKVRIGVIAPRDVPVHRKEVYDAIQKQKESGDSAGGDGLFLDNDPFLPDLPSS